MFRCKGCAILYALRRDRDFGHHKIYLVSDAQEVINTINGANNWASKFFVEDIVEVSKCLFFFFFQLSSAIFLGGLTGLPTVLQSFVLSKRNVLNVLNIFRVG